MMLRLYSVTGRLITKNVNKYKIKWEKHSRSKLQFTVKQFLKKYWDSHVVFEEFPVAGTRLKFDFYNANKRTAVEVHGAQHTKFVQFFHGSKSNFVKQLRRDQQKIDFCELNDIKLVEIFDGDKITKKTFEKCGVYL